MSRGPQTLRRSVTSAAQVQAWLDDPLRPSYDAATARTLAWLVWAVLTIVVGYLAARLRRLPAAG